MRLRRPVGPLETTWELLGAASRFVPDRSMPDRNRKGAGFLARASAARGGFCGHVLFWRGDDFITEEGDRNYLSIRRNGTRYRGVRDYAEGGLTRTFTLGPGVVFAASARLHRTEGYYEYSYRILANVSKGWWLH
jgi:hypothetical protein